MRTIIFFKAALVAFCAASAVMLTGCGAGSVSPTTTTDTTTVTTTAATVQLLVSSTQIPSSGNNTVDVTAVVLNNSGQVIEGKAVIFSTGSDPSAYFSANSGISDANGIVTAKLNLGNDKSNRTILITATADSASGTNSVGVSGTNISFSGNSSIALNNSTSLTISVKDSAGSPISGLTVAVSSANSNTITLNPASGITDSSGQITATVTATSATSPDTITATTAGATKTQSLTISSSTFAFSAPTVDQLIPINSATPISLTWSEGGVGVPASSVTFSSSRGTITGASATTNGSGVATASITSPTTGATIISAVGPGGTPAASRNVYFYTNTASTIAAQATPGTISSTTGTAGQSDNSSVISVVVRDAANNLVQNAQINFNIVVDASGGSLSSATALTDSYGTASINFIAGGSSSPQNGVEIEAEIYSINGTTLPNLIPALAPIKGSAFLTVGGQALNVRLGTDNLVSKVSPMYRKVYSAIVTDSGGRAVSGTTVTFQLRPLEFGKGFWYINNVSKKWTQVITKECLNEDNGNVASYVVNGNSITNTNINIAFPSDDSLRNNGIVDPGEDFNGNNALEPGGVATITPSSVTDEFGVALATITYPMDHAHWALYTVEARAGVNSNDPPTIAIFTLPGLVSDYIDPDVVPPGQFSPFGTGTYSATSTDVVTGVTTYSFTAVCTNTQ